VPKTKQQVIRDHDHKAWLQNQDWWPNYPFQTMKNRRHVSRENPMGKLGLVVGECLKSFHFEQVKFLQPGGEGPVTVFDQIWGLPLRPMEVWPVHQTYESIDAMLADGWEVD
jgi:hypothetical protein